MAKHIVSCEFCGRDTPNKSRICSMCTGGREHSREYASSNTTPLTEWDDECEHDYSEDSLGPKQAENRCGAIWSEEQSVWRKA